MVTFYKVTGYTPPSEIAGVYLCEERMLGTLLPIRFSESLSVHFVKVPWESPESK